uniref:Uncharacterized protein n=1 Tax=Globodera rostochiensis TaxID=31243 RepID=A0A914GVC7_GLORO
MPIQSSIQFHRVRGGGDLPGDPVVPPEPTGQWSLRPNDLLQLQICVGEETALGVAMRGRGSGGSTTALVVESVGTTECVAEVTCPVTPLCSRVPPASGACDQTICVGEEAALGVAMRGRGSGGSTTALVVESVGTTECVAEVTCPVTPLCSRGPPASGACDQTICVGEEAAGPPASGACDQTVGTCLSGTQFKTFTGEKVSKHLLCSGVSDWITFKAGDSSTGLKLNMRWRGGGAWRGYAWRTNNRLGSGDGGQLPAGGGSQPAVAPHDAEEEEDGWVSASEGSDTLAALVAAEAEEGVVLVGQILRRAHEAVKLRREKQRRERMRRLGIDFDFYTLAAPAATSAEVEGGGEAEERESGGSEAAEDDEGDWMSACEDPSGLVETAEIGVIGQLPDEPEPGPCCSPTFQQLEPEVGGQLPGSGDPYTLTLQQPGPAVQDNSPRSATEALDMLFWREFWD